MSINRQQATVELRAVRCMGDEGRRRCVASKACLTYADVCWRMLTYAELRAVRCMGDEGRRRCVP